MLAGGKLKAVLARVHFERAPRHAQHGFHYDVVLDHYDHPQGKRLTLHLESENKADWSLIPDFWEGGSRRARNHSAGGGGGEPAGRK